jgi:gas vesicle protein
MALINIFKGLAGNLMTLWNLIGHAYEYIKNFWNHLLTLIDRIKTLVTDIETEIQAIKDFEFDPRWRTRVISVPVAYQQLHRLAVDIPSEITTAVKDIIEQIRTKVEAGTGETGDFDVEDLEADLKLLPEKLAKAGEKILGFVTLITDAVLSISALVDDLQTLVTDFSEIRQDIENLDAIFLPTGRPRRAVDVHYRKRNA